MQNSRILRIYCCIVTEPDGLHIHQSVTASSSFAFHLTTCHLQCLCLQWIDLFVVGCIRSWERKRSRIAIADCSGGCSWAMIQVQILDSVQTSQSTTWTISLSNKHIPKYVTTPTSFNIIHCNLHCLVWQLGCTQLHKDFLKASLCYFYKVTGDTTPCLKKNVPLCRSL